MWTFLSTLVLFLIHLEICVSLETKNTPDNTTIDSFDIKLTSVSVKTPNEQSSSFTVQFTSWADVNFVWFVDRDTPILGGGSSFAVFPTILKPNYIVTLVSMLDYQTLKTKGIRLQLTANGKSVSIDLNMENINQAQQQTFDKMKFQTVEEIDEKSISLKPLFEIESNVAANTVTYYPVIYTVDTWGGGEVYSIGTRKITNDTSTSTSYGMENPDNTAAITYLKVGYRDGLIKDLILGEQTNPSKSHRALPEGNFAFRKSNIYYKDMKTGTHVDGKLYRCSALGNVELQVLIDNEGTYSNGTDLPSVYVDNGFEKDLYIVRRPAESCTPAVFCQAIYRYRDSRKLSKTTHQLPPRYKPWYDLVNRP